MTERRLPSDAAEIDAVVVNYNSGDDLSWSVAALIETEPERVVSIRVVDNCSTDGSLQRMTSDARLRSSERLEIVELRENVGFGAAVNRGAALGSADLVLVLNPDCRIEPEDVNRLAEVFADPDVGAAGPRISDDEGLPELSWDRDLTLRREYDRSRLWRAARSGDRVAIRKISARVDASRDVDWITGACLMIRRRAFEEIGGFDERFFLYFEDADLCRRLRRRGYRCRHTDRARAIHHRGGAGAPAARVQEAYRRSHRLYYDLYRPWYERWIIRWVHALRP